MPMTENCFIDGPTSASAAAWRASYAAYSAVARRAKSSFPRSASIRTLESISAPMETVPTAPASCLIQSRQNIRDRAGATWIVARQIRHP